jgi:hypothetical protein
MLALGIVSATDWLLAPLGGRGLVLGAPVKALVFSGVFEVWRQVVLEGSLSMRQAQKHLRFRARSPSEWLVPLLFGTTAFLTLSWGVGPAVLFVVVMVISPLFEVALLATPKKPIEFIKAHGVAWAVTQGMGGLVAFATWLAAVMVCGSFHRLVQELVSAVMGGAFLALMWLWRGNGWLLLLAAHAPKDDASARDERVEQPLAAKTKKSRPSDGKPPQ